MILGSPVFRNQSVSAACRLPPASSRKLKAGSRKLLGDDAEDLFLAHDQVFVPFELDLLAGVLAEQDGVAFLDVERRDLAVLLDLTLADGDDLALLRLFLCRIGNDDPADLLLALFDSLHDHPIVQGPDSDCGLGGCHIARTPLKWLLMSGTDENLKDLSC